MSSSDAQAIEVLSTGRKQLSEMYYFVDSMKDMLKMLRESSKMAVPSGPGYDTYLKCSLCYLGESYQNGKIDLTDDGRSTARDIEKHLSSKEHHKNVNEARKPGYMTCMVCDCDIQMSYDNFVSENMIIPHTRELDHEANYAKVKQNIRKFVECEPSSYTLMASEMGEMEHAVSSLSMKIGILKGSFSDFLKQQKSRADEERFSGNFNSSRQYNDHSSPIQHENKSTGSYNTKWGDHFNKPHPVNRGNHYNDSNPMKRSDPFNGPQTKHPKQFNHSFRNEGSMNQFSQGSRKKNDIQQNYAPAPYNPPVSKFGPNNRPKRPHFWCNICMCPIMLEANKIPVFQVLNTHLNGMRHHNNQKECDSRSRFFSCSVCKCKILVSHDNETTLKNLDGHLDGISHIENFTQDEIRFALK